MRRLADDLLQHLIVPALRVRTLEQLIDLRGRQLDRRRGDAELLARLDAASAIDDGHAFLVVLCETQLKPSRIDLQGPRADVPQRHRNVELLLERCRQLSLALVEDAQECFVGPDETPGRRQRRDALELEAAHVLLREQHRLRGIARQQVLLLVRLREAVDELALDRATGL